jgi:hypothetical protein
MDVRRIMLDGMSAKLWLVFILVLAMSFLYQFQPSDTDEVTTVDNVTHFLRQKTIIPVDTFYPTLFSYLATPFITLNIGVGSLLSGATDPQDYGSFL